MGSRFQSKRWLVPIMLVACIAGCSDAVQLIRETDRGGVATYLFKEERGGPMGSPHRRGALQLMQQKCPSGYTVVKEGEVAGYGSMSSVEGQEGESTGRRWGIQFECK
ncbi:MAG: hypothetical protein ICV75_01035 [Nitrospiraceae bacterium]|nr:hypothetical protein [Nitrospiraceae bacterium]